MPSLSPRFARSSSSKPQVCKPQIRVEERLADEARFFRSWLDNPLLAGAVSPSGRFLARMMAHYIDPLSTGPIIELGPGTGAITEALIERGVAPQRLILIEYDLAFCELLRRRFPDARIVQGDAYRLAATLGDALDAPAAAIVSSLPLLTKAEKHRVSLLRDAFDLMAPDGGFVQFTYGLSSPMPRHQNGPTFEAEVSPPVWLNLPPARVWVYRRATASVTCLDPRRSKAAFFDRFKSGTEKMQRDFKNEFESAKARLHQKADQVRAEVKAAHNIRDLKPALAILRKFNDLDRLRRR